MTELIDVTNDKYSKCMTCAYHQLLTTSTVACMYIVETSQRRKCPIGKCDKYAYTSRKEHDDYWKIINNLDNNPDKPNAFTINKYRYLQKEKKKCQKK